MSHAPSTKSYANVRTALTDVSEYCLFKLLLRALPYSGRPPLFFPPKKSSLRRTTISNHPKCWSHGWELDEVRKGHRILITETDFAGIRTIELFISLIRFTIDLELIPRSKDKGCAVG